MIFREFVDSVQSIIAVAELVKNDSKDGTAPMADFLYALKNAGISMDYDKFKSVYDSNPALKNAIQQFDAETVTFVGGEPQADAPAGDIPPDEKVGQMAKRAMNKREDVNEEDDMDRDMSAEEEQFVDMVVDYYKGDMEDAYSIAGDVPRGTSSRRADYLHKEITSRLGIKEMNEESVDINTGKPVPKTNFMGVNVRSKEDRIRDKKTQIELAKRDAPKSGLTQKDVPQLEKELKDLMNEDKSLKAKIDRLEDQNQHGQVALELAKAYGTELEVNLINAINAVHQERGSIEIEERDLRDSITRKYYKKMMSTESSFGDNSMAARGIGINILNKMEQIVDQKGAAEVKFLDGKSKVDMYTASAFMQVYNKVNEANQKKMLKMAETRTGFVSLMKKVFNIISGVKEGKSPHKKGTAKYKKHMAAMHAGESVVEAWQTFKEGVTEGFKIRDKSRGYGVADKTYATRAEAEKARLLKMASTGGDWEVIEERSLTKAEKEKMKHYEKKLDKAEFKKRYGKEGEAVYYATATKMAKKNA